MSVRLATTSLAALLTAVAVGAEPIFDDQRLLTTPQERERLDASRAQAPTAAGVTDANDAPPVAETPAATIRVRGILRRTDGPDRVWLEAPEGTAPDAIRVDGGGVIQPLPDGRTVRLRPGEIYDPETGEVTDAFRR